ncbi:hypothetical protein [Salinisphaera hydrothermalis]|uniref:hypothetical protein n=1 Tax=Salinisphaera hydrothermalis TaxID=563188 RepID=UPI00333FCED7
MNGYDRVRAELCQIAAELDGRDDPDEGAAALSFDDDAERSAGLCGAGAETDENSGVVYEHDVRKNHHVQSKLCQ